MKDIERAVSVIEEAGNKNLCVLHCVSVYPASPETINLNNISELIKHFHQYPVGYSDHTLGTEIASASVALGAALIEKHFTLDREKIGMDNNMATEPDEFAKMIEQCRNVHRAMGAGERVLGPEELEQRKKMRRSVVVTRDMVAGETLEESDMDVKRPGTGFEPGKMKELIGRKLVKEIGRDELLTPGHLEKI